MSRISFADVLELSVEDRIRLAEDIWDSMDSFPVPMTFSQAQRDQIDRRIEAYHQHPEAESPWEEITIRILGPR